MSGSSAADAVGAGLVIAPDATCAAAARRHVTDVMRALGRPELIDAARLAVTELATNAALHARTPVTVNVRLLPGGQVRIDVGDRSPVMPHEQPSRPTSTVGRGLRLVESLGRWGVDPLVEDGRAVGKVVWFSPAGQDGDDDPAPPPRGWSTGPGQRPAPPRDGARSVLGRYATDGSADPPPGAPELVSVRLLNVPLRVFVQAREHHDELLRELALLSLDESRTGRPRGGLPPRLEYLIDVLGRRLGAAEERGHDVRDAAIARGDLVADLTYRLTPAAVDDLVRLSALMDEAERFCREGLLLTMPGLEPVIRFRHWYIDEFTRQLSGHAPTPWDGPLTVDDPMQPHGDRPP